MKSLQPACISFRLSTDLDKMSDPEPLPPKKTRRRQRSSQAIDNGPKNKSDNKEKTPKKPGLMGPTKAETALLPPFTGLSLDQIYAPSSQIECENAVEEILAAGISGFDTEAKPTFRAGQKNRGPHVVQFSLIDKAFIFQLCHPECAKASSELISSTAILKVGFGLQNDHSQIRDRLGIELNHVLDLDQVFRKMGYRGQIGVRGAMGVLLKQSFKKSKSTTTSNWARSDLTHRQLTYAANDAYAALKIMKALKTEGHL